MGQLLLAEPDAPTEHYCSVGYPPAFSGSLFGPRTLPRHPLRGPLAWWKLGDRASGETTTLGAHDRDAEPVARSGPAGGRVAARQPAATPAPRGLGRSLLALQGKAGNAAVAAALGDVRVQRQGRPVSVGPVSFNNGRISIPVPAGATLQASVPRGQAVTWSLVPGTATVDPGSSIDAAGLVTLAGAQQGGRISALATDSGGSGATASREVFLVKAPGSIASTAETSGTSAANYGAGFKHTFAPVGSGSGSECEGGRVNERFPGVPTPEAASHAMTTPFGPFTLATNDPANTAGGWGIDGSGTMTGDDHVTIGRAGVDIRPFIRNTSNPTPAQSLPASFTVQQALRSVEVPTNTFRAPFTTIPHVRGLRETGASAEFFVSTNGTEHTDTYTGRPAIRNARAASASVMASLPAPRQGPRPAPTTVQISADSVPAGGRIVFSIPGPALGCTINRTTGLLTIGSTPGTVTVRAAETQGVSFDEVKVTITARPAPATPGGPGGGGGAPGGGAPHTEADIPPDGEEAEATA